MFSAGKDTVGPRRLAHSRRHVRINSWPPSRVAASRSANRILENSSGIEALSKTGSAGPEFLRAQPNFDASLMRQWTDLGQFDLGASCFQLAFDLFCFCLVHAFFDLAASFDQFFGFFQAQACDAANFFDDVDF